MSPSKGKGDLPGFYTDPKTGKSYRENPGDAITRENIKRLKQSVVEITKHSKKKLIRNTLTYLENREITGLPGFPSLRSYYEMRIANKSLKCDVDLNSTQALYPGITSVEFIKRGPTSIYGMWNRTLKGDKDKNPYVVGQIPLNDASPPSDVPFHFISDYVLDMCENTLNTYVYIANSPETALGTQMLVWRTNRGTESYSHYHSLQTTYYSCTHIVEEDNNIRVALGGERIVAEYNGLQPAFKLPVTGNVHTVCYDKSATTLLFGTNKGTLNIIDLREELDEEDHPPAVRVKVFENCLVDSYYLNDTQIIITGLNNQLETFDLRNRQVVTSFLGHHSSLKKRSVSVANDLVCATGADNVIRIWHTSGGVPLHEIRPSNPNSTIRGCISGSQKGTYLYYFEGSTEKIYEL